MRRRALLDHATATGRPVHVIAGIGVDDLARIGLRSVDAPLAALAWVRLEVAPSGALEVAHSALSMRLEGDDLARAAGRIVFVLESPSSRLIDLSRRGPIVGHALESTLLARLDERTAAEISPCLVDLVDLAADEGIGVAPGDRALARLLGREPAEFPNPLERAELLARLYRPSVERTGDDAADALVVEEDGSSTEVHVDRLNLAETLEGTPERIGLGRGLVMIAAAERLNSSSGSHAAIGLLRALGGAPELRPGGRVIVVDRDRGASLRAALPDLHEIVGLPRRG
jgi:hypothetical protein